MIYKESYTVKEIADILGVSKTTIQKYIKTSAIDYDYVDKNKQYFSIDKTKNIIKGIRNDFDVAEIENRQPPTETRQPKTDNQTANLEGDGKLQTQSDGGGWRNIDEVRQPPTENRQPPTETRQPKTENKINDLENKLFEMIDTLQKQLDIKDEQIKVLNTQLEFKDKQIKDYSDRLAEALQLTAGQQLIHAVDKKEMLMENKEENSIVNISEDIDKEDKEEKSIIKKLFSIFK